IFSDYMRPSARLACLMDLPVVYVWTHDSIGLGGDGPTHQPVEQLASLRAMPRLRLIRPADGPETAEAWRSAIARTDGATALALSRQDLPPLDRSTYAGAAGPPPPAPPPDPPPPLRGPRGPARGPLVARRRRGRRPAAGPDRHRLG